MLQSSTRSRLSKSRVALPKDFEAKLMSNVSMTFKSLYSPNKGANGAYQLKPVALPPTKKKESQKQVKPVASHSNLQARMSLHEFQQRYSHVDSFGSLARGAARVASGSKSSMEVSQQQSKSKFNKLTAANIARYRKARIRGGKSALSVSTGAAEFSTVVPPKRTVLDADEQRERRTKAVEIKVHDPLGVTAVDFSSARGSAGEPGAHASAQLLADAAKEHA